MEWLEVVGRVVSSGVERWWHCTTLAGQTRLGRACTGLPLPLLQALLIAVAAGAALCTLGHLGTLRLGGKAPLWTLGTEYPIGGSMQSVDARLGAGSWPAFAPGRCLCKPRGIGQHCVLGSRLLSLDPRSLPTMSHPPAPLPRRRAGGGVRLCGGRHVDCALCHRDCGPAAVLWHAEVRGARCARCGCAHMRRCTGRLFRLLAAYRLAGLSVVALGARTRDMW